MNPTILEIHPGTSCSLKCDFCYRDTENYEIGKKQISGKKYQSLIRKFAKLGGQEVYISGGFEPFSQVNSVQSIIQQASKSNLKTRIYTNGVSKILSDKNFRKFLILRVEQIRFSIHAISPTTYCKITHTSLGGALLSTIVENICYLIRERSEKSRLKVGIGFLVVPKNIDEMMTAAMFWSERGIDFFDLRFDVIEELGRREEFVEKIEHFQDFVGRHPSRHMKVSIGDRAFDDFHFASKCFAPFKKIVVDPFGLVWCCCIQAQPGYRQNWSRLGDLRIETLSQIVKTISETFPKPHCEYCTPWEAKYNESCCSNHGSV